MVRTAFRLVEAAQQAFLEARQAAETSAISESIGILERYSQSLHGDVNRTLTELQATHGTRACSRGQSVPAARHSSPLAHGVAARRRDLPLVRRRSIRRSNPIPTSLG